MSNHTNASVISHQRLRSADEEEPYTSIAGGKQVTGYKQTEDTPPETCNGEGKGRVAEVMGGCFDVILSGAPH